MGCTGNLLALNQAGEESWLFFTAACGRTKQIRAHQSKSTIKPDPGSCGIHGGRGHSGLGLRWSATAIT